MAIYSKKKQACCKCGFEISVSLITEGYCRRCYQEEKPFHKYVETYMDFFGYTEADFVPCEICSKQAVDVHHIHRRGRGGSKEWDTIENLMALCRQHHMEYGDVAVTKPYLYKIHLLHVQARNPEYPIEGQYMKYLTEPLPE
jgi:hypothetical protein